MQRCAGLPSTSAATGRGHGGAPLLNGRWRARPRGSLRCAAAPAARGQGERQVVIVQQKPQAGIFIPAPPPGQAFFIVCVAGVIASVVDNPVRRAVRRWLKIGGENKVISSWDNLSKSSIDESTYSRDYQQALARTRQAIAVQRAVDYNRVRNTQRAVVELQKALKEHEVCRSPVLPNSAGSEQDVDDLYCMALTSLSPRVPPDYGTILELRSVLGMDTARAERLERMALQQPGSFSI